MSNKTLEALATPDLTRLFTIEDWLNQYISGLDEGYAMGVRDSRKKAIKEQKQLFISQMLHHTDIDDEKIAMLGGVSLKFVEKVKAKLANEKQ